MAKPILRQAWPWALVFLGGWVYLVSQTPRQALVEGQDHWVTGHALLLAKGYLAADFRTPWFWTMENPFGPVEGRWQSYTGWPPLFFLLLAGYQKVAGSGLFAARLFFCAIQAMSVTGVGLLAWRFTRHRLAAVAAVVVFLSHPLVILYAGFGFSDTLALAWMVFATLGFLPCLRGVGRGGMTAACGFAVLGACISWQCPVVGVGLVGAAACTGRLRGRAPVRWAVPLAVLLTVSLGVLLFASHLDRAHPGNGWGGLVDGSGIWRKLLFRTSWDQPVRAAQSVIGLIRQGLETSSPLLAGLVLLASVRVWLVQEPRAAKEAPPEPPERWAGVDPDLRFLLLALLGVPVLWCLAMPNMQYHSFQWFFWMPWVALLSAAWVARLVPDTGAFRRPLRLVCWILLAGISAWNLRFSHRPTEPEHFHEMREAIQRLAPPGTVVVLETEDRGLWWEINRPVLGIRFLNVAQSRPHVVVLQKAALADEKDYTVLLDRRFPGDDWKDYRILKPAVSRSGNR